MRKVNNLGIRLVGYNEVQAFHPGDVIPLTAGGYVCIINNAILGKTLNHDDKLTLILDIVEGEFKGIFKNHPYPPKFNTLIFKDGKIFGMCKALLDDVKNSNQNLNFNIDNFDPACLINKFCGFVFADEEYIDKNGNLRIATVPKRSYTVEEIHSGKFTVPPLKTVDRPATTAASSASSLDDNLVGDEIPDDRVPF